MPSSVTHMYLAAQLALKYKSSSNGVLRKVNQGFGYWLNANKTFQSSANRAIAAKSIAQFTQACQQYQANLNEEDSVLNEEDSVAVFSAFAAGSIGPDLWIVPHSLRQLRNIVGKLHFDLGHYNLSHNFPKIVLKRIKETSATSIQKEYQTAYVLGYLSHIALDILGHVMVNVTAGAYQMINDIWENEQGSFTMNIWKTHNKVEHFVDALIKYLCFEGCHDKINSKFSYARSAGFGPKWNFPCYHAKYRASIEKLFPRSMHRGKAIHERHEKLLGVSTSLPAVFAERYRSKEKKVTPFILEDYKKAYAIADPRIRNNALSITRLASEEVKLNFFRFANTSNLSHYYYLTYPIPNMKKVLDWTDSFYDPTGYANFIQGSHVVAEKFIDCALDYLKTGNISALEVLDHWNLDVGMRIQIKDQSSEKPKVPVCIELVNIADDVSKFGSWSPSKLTRTSWRNDKKSVSWNVPKRISNEQKQQETKLHNGKSGQKTECQVVSESGIDISFATFSLFDNSNELAGYVFGTKLAANFTNIEEFRGQPPTPTPVLYYYWNVGQDSEDAYKLDTCLEDFVKETSWAQQKPDETVGGFSLKRYCATFLSPIPVSASASTKPLYWGKPPTPRPFIPVHSKGHSGWSSKRPCGSAEFPNTNLLTHNVKIATCRKWVCGQNDTGNFSPNVLQIYSNSYPTEEMAFGIVAVIDRQTEYVDLFQHTVFSYKDIEALKHIKTVGLNVILLVFLEESINGKTLLKLSDAYIDGEARISNGLPVQWSSP